jgi:hypothetical protein
MAENTSINPHSVDLITVANALHWFNFELFYAETKRVLKTNGIIAAWSYLLPSVSYEVDKIVEHFHYETLNAYWLPENRLIEKGYETIPFPFEQVNCPRFFCERLMLPDDLIGYLNTWSATQRFIRENGSNPVEILREQLITAWGEKDSQKKVTWELILKVGKMAG